MTTTNARYELSRTNIKFATQFGKYELQFDPHLLGAMVTVSSQEKDELCGTWLLCDSPAKFIVVLGSAARVARNLKGRKRRSI